MTSPREPAAPLAADTGDAYEASVLRAFLRNGRLVTIPAQQQKKKDVILRFLLNACFADDRTYGEREVTERLRPYHDDVAALRRCLVETGLLTREAGPYRRARSNPEPDQ